MIAAFISVGVMAYVLFAYGLKDDSPPPTSRKTEQPHAGMAHFTTESPPHEGGKLSPIQVFENANVGDWLAYRVTTESSIAQTFHAIGIETISTADDKTVARAFSGRVEETGKVEQRQYEDRPRAGLTLDQLTTNDVGGWTIYEVAISDDVHEVGGRKFNCKKISYASNDPLIPNKRTHTDLWISTEVPVGGLVEEREIQDMPSVTFTITKEVIGFGDAKGTTWGEKPSL